MLTNRSTIHMYLFCLGVLLMVIGFLCSRLLLSTGMIAVIANGFAQGDLRERLGRFSTDKLSMGISSLFLLPFLSGLWSSDKQTWAVLMLDKLPLLLLPFALVQQKGIGPKQLNRFKLLWIVAMFAGSVWSTLQYLFAFRYFNHAYQFSQVIPTPVAGDHIRFSMGIIIALLFYLQLYERKDQQGKAYSLLSAIALWLVFYLHLLGAKTGLVGLYAVVLPFFSVCTDRENVKKPGLFYSCFFRFLFWPMQFYQHFVCGYIMFCSRKRTGNRSSLPVVSVMQTAGPVYKAGGMFLKSTL